MESLSGPVDEQLCDGCLGRSSELAKHGGDLCAGCRSALWAAAVLLENSKKGAATEDEVIPTLVCAHKLGLAHGPDALTPDPGVARYPVVEQVTIEDDVPIMRVVDLAVEPEMHAGTQVLRRVHIQVLTKHVEAGRVRESYRRLLTDHGARWERNHYGRFSYGALLGTLQIAVETGPEWELSSFEVRTKARTLQGPAWHFPAPALVARTYVAFRGPMRGGSEGGFARALDLYGKPEPKGIEKIVPAFFAWQWGSKTAPNAGEEVNTNARPRVARLLNKHVMDARAGMPPVPEEGWQCTGSPVWGDVKALWPRFVRLEQLLG